MCVSNHVKGEEEWEKELRGGGRAYGARVQPCAGVYTCTQNRCFPPHLQAPWLGTATLALFRQRLAYPPSVQLRLWVKWCLISQQRATGWRLMEPPPFWMFLPLLYTQICGYCTQRAARRQNQFKHWRMTRYCGKKVDFILFLCCFLSFNWIFRVHKNKPLSSLRLYEWETSDPALLNNKPVSDRVIKNDNDLQ